MKNITEFEILTRLNSLDEDTLNFLFRYREEKRRLISFQTWISATIASVAGLALSISHFFPESSQLLIATVSAISGLILGWWWVLDRKKEERRLIELLLKETFQNKDPSLPNQQPNAKKELIEKILKAEGL